MTVFQPNEAADVLARYGAMRTRYALAVMCMVILCCGVVLLDIGTGALDLGLLEVMRGLFSPDLLQPQERVVIWDVRLPVALMAPLVGASLALAGTEMQTILNNPLASPFTLGVSSAAAFGASLTIVLGISIPFVPAQFVIAANAFLFAFGSVLLLYALAARSGGVEIVVLFGIAFVFTFNALVALIQFVASADALQQLVFWGMGNLTVSTWISVASLAAVFAVVVPFSFAASSKMTALRFGEERALSIGVDTARLRLFSMIRISLLAATSVAFVGTIGFVGLVGPHIARLIVGEDHRFLLPASALCGALLMSCASLVSKVAVPGIILPVGIVTSLVGLPVFFMLIWKRTVR
jgi:iron complex transport system permease protein